MGFNARFDLNYATLSNFDTMDEWEISGYVVDNSGTYFPSDSKVGDIIYLNSYDGIKRYEVIEIISVRPQYIAKIKWDMTGVDPFEPLAGYDGLIGESTGKLKLATLTSWTINGLTESFVSNIKNYQSLLMEKGTLISPEFEGMPTAPTPDMDSDNNQIATTEWVNKKLADINCEGEIKEFTAGDSIKQFDLLYLDSDNTVKLCDANNINCADAIIGFALQNGNINEKIEVLMEGVITNNEWDFEKFPTPLFVGLNGDFVQLPSEDYKFLQQIGTSIDFNTINLEIEESIIL